MIAALIRRHEKAEALAAWLLDAGITPAERAQLGAARAACAAALEELAAAITEEGDDGAVA